MSEDWTSNEVKYIVQDYFAMFQLEYAKKDYNKAAHRRSLLPQLNSRTAASVEFKHRNISAVLANMGLPYINGYKPAFNYQRETLEKQVADFLKNYANELELMFESFANSVQPPQVEQLNFASMEDEAPERSVVKEYVPRYRPIKINYLEKEQNNRTLGQAGEELVIEYERWRLQQAGKYDLADKIEWVSKEQGDGLGFDILSKNIDGSDKYVEVKTTKLPKETPIYLTRTELKFAISNTSSFCLYRVFNFGTQTRFFIKEGQYDGYCTLEPVTYKGVF